MTQYLYLIKCQQFYKIGIAVDVENRLAQLATGNPFPLEVEIVYEFDNAEYVERALHQRYQDARQRGEWFSLSYQDTVDIHNVCLMLGGRAFEYTGRTATEEVIEEAERIAEPTEGGKWDYAAMFADGWRMEKTTNGRHIGGGSKYWCWRKGSGFAKKYIYGGALSELPRSIEEMRQIYKQEGE